MLVNMILFPIIRQNHDTRGQAQEGEQVIFHERWIQQHRPKLVFFQPVLWIWSDCITLTLHIVILTEGHSIIPTSTMMRLTGNCGWSSSMRYWVHLPACPHWKKDHCSYEGHKIITTHRIVPVARAINSTIMKTCGTTSVARDARGAVTRGTSVVVHLSGSFDHRHGAVPTTSRIVVVTRDAQYLAMLWNTMLTKHDSNINSMTQS